MTRKKQGHNSTYSLTHSHGPLAADQYVVCRCSTPTDLHLQQNESQAGCSASIVDWYIQQQADQLAHTRPKRNALDFIKAYLVALAAVAAAQEAEGLGNLYK